MWDPAAWGNTHLVTFTSTEDGSDIWVPDLCVYETIDAQRIYDRVDYQARREPDPFPPFRSRSHALSISLDSPLSLRLSCGALLLLPLPCPIHARRSRTTAR